MSGAPLPLPASWQMVGTAPGAFAEPQSLAAAELDWIEAIVPGTVAQSLKIDIGATCELDSRDWWYRGTFAAPSSTSGAVRRLCFEGLATHAEVWLNGELIISARNMFLPHSFDVSSRLLPENVIHIRFASLDAELALRKPRPRWKTALISHQNLRWVRTTLLGRIPGWSPPIAPIGPWKQITLETLDQVQVERVSLSTSARAGNGTIQIGAEIKLLGPWSLHAATLHVGAQAFRLETARKSGEDPSRLILSGSFQLSAVAHWWPHTHGEPTLHDYRIELKLGTETLVIDRGSTGFRSIAVDRTDGKLQFVINGVPVFCRGACWTVNDILSLTGSAANLRTALELAKESGLNMLRVGGTMTYETDEFYRLCDELGILVWQDFMFANMDYPVKDPGFAAEIEREARHQLGRLSRHPCIAVYCGGSEVQQQSAMMGLPQEYWSNDFFDLALPALCDQLHAGIPYFPSSPCEGALPFHVSAGIAHYYGVGAYRRPLNEVKHAQVKFAAECLGFSNIPERSTMELLGNGAILTPDQPLWKARQPRDTGADWDFEDVRDHYLKALFGLDPATLRVQDVERYYAISRSVSGEVMKFVFSEWRKPGSGNGGGLVWFFNDLWPGAGWGIIDSLKRPKSVWFYLRRAWAAQAVLITDEGLDGLQIHVLNESPKPLKAILGLEFFAQQRIRTAAPDLPVEIAAHGARSFGSDALMGYFTDVTNAYRFGPPKYDVVRATLREAGSGHLMGEDFYFPQGLDLARHDSGAVQVEVLKEGADFQVSLRSRHFLQCARLSAPGFTADDCYFHLAPNEEKRISFRAVPGQPPLPFNVELSALNLKEPMSACAPVRDF